MDPGQPYLIPIVLLVVARLLAWTSIPAASEDAYITFRYAQNLISGYGLTYNPGEHVMGFTSPLWTLWIALGMTLTVDPMIWTRVTTLFADVVTLVLAVQLLRRHASTTSAWLFAVFFAAWPYFSAVAVSGMENSMMLMLILLAATLAGRRTWTTGPALAALALIRPEGVVVAALIALRAPWRDRLVAAGLVGAAAVALTLYYGSPIPQSLLAKSQIYGTPGPWSGRSWWEWVFPMALGRWPILPEGNMMFPLAVLVAPGIWVGARRLWRERATPLAVAGAAMLLVWVSYAVLGVAYFYWYLAVPLAGIALVAAVGLPDIVRSRLMYAACALVVIGAWTLARPLYIGRAQNEVFGFGGASDYLSGHALVREKIMLEPIGMIGYSLPLIVIDEVGLVTPEVARRRLLGAGWYADIAGAERPEWIVIRSSARASDDAFAGVSAPFRNPAERDSLFARYSMVHVSDPGRMSLEVWRRAR
jgi:hypothetical protein